MNIKGIFAAARLAAVLFMSGAVLAGVYSGGDGSVGAAYQIADLEDWRELRDTPADWGCYFILTADIDLAGETGTTAVIAPDTDPQEGFQGTAFTGHFDGNGKSIHHLTIDTLADADSSNDSNGYLGLFGQCSRAVIQRLSLKNSLIRSGNSAYVGGLCGQNRGGQLVQCGFEGRVESGDFSVYVGGLVGESSWLWYLDANFNDVFVAAEIDRCYTRGFVTGGINVGGLAGQSGVSQAVMSYADAIVSGGLNVGGFIGQHYGHVAIANCYATGSVNGQTDTGGFIGRSWAVDSDDGIVNCYAAGAVQGGPGTGGFIGSADHAHITHQCFWDIQAAGQTESAGGEGKLTSEMQTASPFIAAGWDFAAPVWRVCGQAAPTLAWNHPDLDNSGRVDWADFVKLADHWQDTECGFCGNADLTGDRNITLDDLLVFASAWMTSDSIAHHVYRIEIETSWDYELTDDPADDEYVFELNVMTDARVVGAAFTTPAGNTFTIPNMPVSEGVELSKGYYEIGREYDAEYGVYEWTYAFDFYSADSLSAYGDGLYTITVTYEGGREEQTTAWFGIPGTNDPIPQPTQMPVFTGFSNGEMVSSPVTFSWEACTDPAAQHLWLEYESYALAVDEAYWLPIFATELGAPVDMPAGEYEVSLGFQAWHETSNSDGILVSVGKYSECVYDIRVVNETLSDHVFEIGLTAERDYGVPGDSSDDEYAIEVEVFTDGTVERIEFTTPAGYTFEIPNTPITEYAIDGGYLEIGREFDEDSGQYAWIYCPGFISPESLSAYGDGLYTFTVYFADGYSRQTTAWFGIPGTADPIPQPTQAPVITSFDAGESVTSPVTFSWEAYSGSAAHVVWLYVFSEDDEREWTLPISATGLDEPLALPSGWHKAELEFAVYYESVNDDGIVIDAGKFCESDYAFYVE